MFEDFGSKEVKVRVDLHPFELSIKSKENILILITKFVDVIIVNITVYIFVEFIFFCL